MNNKQDESAGSGGPPSAWSPATAPTPTPIAFLGTPDVSRVCADALLSSGAFDIRVVVTQPDKPAGRGKVLTGSPLKAWAQRHNLPVITPTSIRRETASFLEELRHFGELKALVVVSFGQILPQGLLDAYPGRCINVHFSLLPRWRGANPTQRAILAGDAETGVCLMQMEAGLDTGPVFAVQHATVSETDTLDSLLARLAELGGTMLVQHLPAIIDGKLHPTPQPNEGVSHAAKLAPEEIVINFQNSAAEISRQIRALWSTPGAYSSYHQQRVRFVPDEKLAALDTFEAPAEEPPSEAPNPRRAVSKHARPEPPGQILACDKHGIIISCGKGFLKINSLQFPGGRPLKAAEIANGRKLQVGDCFGLP